jgi:hypothetical protein
MCQYLDWEINVKLSTLREFEAMICKDFARPGLYTPPTSDDNLETHCYINKHQCSQHKHKYHPGVWHIIGFGMIFSARSSTFTLLFHSFQYILWSIITTNQLRCRPPIPCHIPVIIQSAMNSD